MEKHRVESISKTDYQFSWGMKEVFRSNMIIVCYSLLFGCDTNSKWLSNEDAISVLDDFPLTDVRVRDELLL